MKTPCVGLLLPVLLLALAAPAAERLKKPSGAEDANYLKNNRPAMLVKWEHPQYAPEPGAEWVQQAVRVAFEVDTDGAVVDPRVMGGAEKFREAALAAVARWKLSPELVDGQPTRVTKEVRLVFTPKGTPKKTSRDDFMAPYMVEYPEVSPPGEPANGEALYPPALLPRRLSGEVDLMVSVDREGRIDGVKVLRATHPDFLGAAVETVAGWKVRPALQGKTPLPGQKGVLLTFFPVDQEGKPLPADWLERSGVVLRDNPAQGASVAFDHIPKATALVDPVYPRELLRAGTRGAARVDFSVDLEGRVVGVRVAEATLPEFGEAVAAAVAAWRFEPLERGGQPAGADFSLTWRFKEPAADSAEQRLLANLGTERDAVGARQLDRPLFPLFTRLPAYPAGRLEAREAGTAEIEVVIDHEGRVRLPHIRNASQPEFGWAAATAVSQWLFETPRKDGQPVDARVVVPVQFKPPEPER